MATRMSREDNPAGISPDQTPTELETAIEEIRDLLSARVTSPDKVLDALRRATNVLDRIAPPS